MSDISIPVPYNGGTLQTGIVQSHYCYLGNGKFLNVAAQLTPGYVYAWVQNDTNITSGTFTSVNPSMRAIMSGSQAPGAINAIRLFKLTSSSAVLVINASLFVLSVGSNDDVTLKNASLPAFFNLPYGGPIASGNASIYSVASANTPAIGSQYQIFYARDNVIYTMNQSVSSGTVTVVFKKVVYDPTGDAFSSSTLYTYTAASSSYPFVRAELNDIPNSTTKLLSLRVQNGNSTVTNSSMAQAFVRWAALIDSSDTITTVTPTSLNVQALAPLSTTNILGFDSQKTYYTFNGTSWNTTPAYFVGNVGTPSAVIFRAEAIDTNYFLLVSANGLSNPGISVPTDVTSNNFPAWSVRVGRFVDSGFGQTSAGSSSGGGYTVATTGIVFFDQQFIFRDGTSAFYFFSRSVGSFTPNLRTIYAPGG